MIKKKTRTIILYMISGASCLMSSKVVAANKPVPPISKQVSRINVKAVLQGLTDVGRTPDSSRKFEETYSDQLTRRKPTQVVNQVIDDGQTTSNNCASNSLDDLLAGSDQNDKSDSSESSSDSDGDPLPVTNDPQQTTIRTSTGKKKPRVRDRPREQRSLLSKSLKNVFKGEKDQKALLNLLAIVVSSWMSNEDSKRDKTRNPNSSFQLTDSENAISDKYTLDEWEDRVKSVPLAQKMQLLSPTQRAVMATMAFLSAIGVMRLLQRCAIAGKQFYEWHKKEQEKESQLHGQKPSQSNDKLDSTELV